MKENKTFMQYIIDLFKLDSCIINHKERIYNENLEIDFHNTNIDGHLLGRKKNLIMKYNNKDY